MQRIKRELSYPAPERIRVTTPAARVKLGDTFIVEAGTCVKPVVRSREDCCGFIEREETGPIYVDGIRAGDMLNIKIEHIEIVGHATGEQEGASRKFFEVRPKDGVVICHGGLPVPIEPMIGVICVVPRDPAEVSYDLGDCGGNMDYRDICPGNSVCLRARHDGGLVFLGDIHAYQGWGEWLGAGCECAGDVTVTVTKEDFYISDRPVVLKKDSYTCIACRPSYGEAVDLALHDAAGILVKMTGVSFADALGYCRLVGNGMNGQMWQLPYPELYSPGAPVNDMPATVGIEIPTDILKKHRRLTASIDLP